MELETGEEVADPPFDVASYDPEKAAADAELGRPAPENLSSIQRLPKYSVVYQVLGDSGAPSMVVIPIKGYGLWSTLYGFLAIDADTYDRSRHHLLPPQARPRGWAARSTT